MTGEESSQTEKDTRGYENVARENDFQTRQNKIDIPTRETLEVNDLAVGHSLDRHGYTFI